LKIVILKLLLEKRKNSMIGLEKEKEKSVVVGP